jgi:hypothetical protein
VGIGSRGAILRASKDGKLLWEVKSEQADFKIDPKGDSAEMKGVEATLYEQGVPSMKLTAPFGNANEATGRLSLRGGVKAASTDGHTLLTCDRIAWAREDRVLVANGHVSGVTSGISIGPAETVRARFESKGKEMNTTTASLVLVSLLAQGQSIHYRDRAGNMDVTAKKFEIKRDEKANVFRFIGTGAFVAMWLKQGLETRGDKMEGTLQPVGDSYELQAGSFSGNVEAHLKADTGNFDLTGISVWTIERSQDGKLWNFTGDGAPFVGKLRNDEIVITGHHVTGTATRLTGGGINTEWRTAVFSGGVKAVIKQLDKKTGKSYTITASAPTVTLNREAATAVMSGGVTASGDHPALGPGGGEITAGKVTLEFDKEMRTVKNLTMESD